MAMTDAEKAGIKVEVIPDSELSPEGGLATDPLVVSDVGVARPPPEIPVLGGRPVQQYNVDLDEYFKVTADELSEAGKKNDMGAVSRKLASDLVEKAKNDPQFEGFAIDWDEVATQDPDRIIRTFVSNVREKRQSLGDDFALAAESFTRGFAKGAPSFYAGMKTGSAAFQATPGGPLPKLFGFFGGFAVGSGITALVADAIMEAVAPEQEIAPEDRFLRNSTKAAGELIPGLGLRAMAKEGSEFVSEKTMAELAKRSRVLKDGRGLVNRMNRIMNGSQRVSGKVLSFAERVNNALARSPTKGLTRETNAVLAAGVLGAIGDEMKPGDPLYRLSGELLGGFGVSLTPTTWIAGKLVEGGRAVKQTISNFRSESAREQRAVAQITEEAARETMTAKDMSPEDALKFLDEEIENIRIRVAEAEQEGRVIGTLGQLTDVPYLQKLTKRVMQNNSELSEQARASANAVIEKQIELIEALYKEGTPDAVRSALLLQENFYENMLDSLLSQETFKAMERLNNLLKPVAEDGVRPVDTGEVIATVLQRVTRLARDQESQLWDAVPQDLDASGSNVARVFQEIAETEYNPGDAIPALIRNFPENLGGEFGTQATPEIIAAQNQLSDISKAIDKLMSTNPRAIPAFEEAVQHLKEKNVRTMNLGLDDFDPRKSEAAQVFEYLNRRLQRLGTKGIAPAQRKELEAARKLAELQLSKEQASAQLAASVPEGGTLPNATTTGQLITFRKQMNRIAMNQGESNAALAGQASRLARAALDDLAEVGTDDLAYESARSFSRVFNDRFTRSVVGDIIGFGGKVKVQPEKVTPTLIRANDVQSAINIRQVDQALKFLAERDPKYADLMDTELNTIQQQYDAFMRLLIGGYVDEAGVRVGGIVDDETGLVNPNRLNTFLNNKGMQIILEYLPALRRDLQDLKSAQRLVDTMARGKTEQTQTLRDIQAFVKGFTEYESGPDALDGIIGLPGQRQGIKTPAANFEKFVKLVTTRNNQSQELTEQIVAQETKVANIAQELDNRRSQGAAATVLNSYEVRLTNEQARLDALRNRLATSMDEPEPVIIDETTPIPVIGAEKPGGVTTSVQTGETLTPANVVNGLKETVFERAFTFASTPDGPKTRFNPFKFEAYLFQPLASGKDSVAVILNRNGVLSEAEINHIKNVLETIKKSAGKSQYLGEMPDLVQIEQDSLSALARVAGVKFSEMVAPVSSMGQLQSANIFSNMFHKIAVKMPQHKQQLLFTRMSKDPKFFLELVDNYGALIRPAISKKLEASLIDRAVEATKEFLADGLGVRLSNAAVLGALQEALNTTTTGMAEEEVAPPPQQPAPRPTPTPEPVPQNTVPESRPTPQVPPTTTPQVPPTTTPTGPSQASAPAPQTRQRMSALFPNDPVLGASQGIASLMG